MVEDLKSTDELVREERRVSVGSAALAEVMHTKGNLKLL